MKRVCVLVVVFGFVLSGLAVDPVAGLIAGGAFARPAIAAGPDGSVFVAVEGDRMGSVHLFKSGSTGWTGGVVLASKCGGFVDAGRVYVPDLVVDPDGWAFVSARAGPKEWGTMHGPVVAVRSPSGAVTTRFLGSKAFPGAARLARDPARAGPVLLTKDGNWWELTRAAGTAASGRFNSGGTGEKYAFQVASDGTWWTAINGCRVDPSSVSIGGRRIVWADYNTYGRWYGSDLCYVSLLVVGNVGYVAATMGGRVRIQVIKNGVCRYPITNLADLGPGSLEDRCPPRLLKVKGGPVAVWSFGGAVLAVRVKDCLAGRAKPVQVAVGAFPAVCLLADGRIGVVTVRRDGLYFAAVAAP